MPSYKTHSIHGELVLNDIDKKVEIDRNDIRTFCFGFDTLIFSDYSLFKYQHRNNTKDYFETLLQLIKEKGLQDNSEVMAFIYGQLDHFVLDIVIHPLIYYMTSDISKEHKFNPHALVEMWMDDYVLDKYKIDDSNYYNKWRIKDKDLKTLINEVYKTVYNKTMMVLKYDLGITSINLFDSLARKNALRITPLICKMLNIGDIIYSDDLERVLPYINLEHDIWYNPETCEEVTSSFDDLWKESISLSQEVISDVNGFLYSDKPLTNKIITGNICANTGLPCEVPQLIKMKKRY